MELKKLSARQLLAITYAKLKKKLGAKKIVLSHDAYALIADDSDWHRTRQGFSRYQTASIFKINKVQYALAFGVACGSYPADPYNCDIAFVEIQNFNGKKDKTAEIIHDALEKNGYYYSSLIHAMSSGVLVVNMDGKFGKRVFEQLKDGLEKFIAKKGEARTDVLHLDLRPVMISTNRYKPELADHLAKVLYEIIKSESKKEVVV